MREAPLDEEIKQPADTQAASGQGNGEEYEVVAQEHGEGARQCHLEPQHRSRSGKDDHHHA